MKKLMALCLSLLMVLSMCSFTVFADGEAAVAVTFADIADGQPQNFVTGNLVLGTNDVITSSNEAVIATNGTVTRPIYEDAKVTLTINGGDAVDVTVKARTTNVLYANDFSTGVGSEWSLTAPTGNTVSSVGNGVLNVIIGATTVNRTSNVYYPAAVSGTRPVTFQFDMSNITGLVSSGADIRISGNRYDAEGNKIGGFSTITVARCRTTSGFGEYWMGAYRKSNVEIKYDPTTGEFWGNGTKSTNNLFSYSGTNGTQSIDNGYTTDDVAKVVITSITITNAGSGCTATFDMDNFVQYEDVPAEDALASATPAELLAHYSYLLDKDYVANGGKLDALTTNLKFTADGLPAGVSLTWTSTNPAIAADGTVKRPILEAATATITGTLKAGEKSISKSYDVTILPLTKSFISEVLDAESHDVGDMFITSDGWSPQAYKKTWDSVTVLEESDGNKYYRVTSDENSGGVAPVYSFKNYPSALNEGEKLVFEGRVKAPQTAGLMNYTLHVNDLEIGEFIWWAGNLYDQDYSAGWDDYHGKSGYRQNDIKTKANQWYRIKLEVYADTESTTGWSVKCYIDDELVGDHQTYKAMPESITSIKYVTKTRYNYDSSTGTVTNSFDFDDICVYTQASLDSVLASLSDADKVDFYKQLIEASNIGSVTAAGAVLDLDNGYADYNPATYGVAVNWTSSNTAYIANDGTVKKLAPYGEAVTVNMTATITAGGAEATVVVPVAIPDMTSIDTALHYAYDFTDYTAPDGAKYEIVADEDASHGNVLKLDSANGSSATIAHKAYGDGTRKDRFVIETDFKYDSSSTTGYPYFEVTTSAGATGIRVDVNYNTGKVRLLTTKTALDGYDFKVSGNNLIDYDMPESVKAKQGEWTHLLIDYNALSETYQVSIDGIVINDIPVLNAAIVPTRTGGSVRHIYYKHSGTGVLYADNLSVKDYDDDNVIEVNAALNAALTLYANEAIHPVLSNRTLWNKGIGLSWTDDTGATFNKDESDLGNNPAGYKAVEDGPALTYTVDGKPATAISATKATEAEITITATKNGYSESKTFTRDVAPVVIDVLSLGTDDCLNGVWAEGATGTEKLIVAKYLGGQLVNAEVIDFAETKDTGSRYDTATGFVKDLSEYTHPSLAAEYDQIKLFVVAADGITPLAYANAKLHD